MTCIRVCTCIPLAKTSELSSKTILMRKSVLISYVHHLATCHFLYLMSTLTLQLEDDSGIHNLQLYCHGFVFMFHLESSKTQRQNKGEQTSCYDV